MQEEILEYETNWNPKNKTKNPALEEYDGSYWPEVEMEGWESDRWDKNGGEKITINFKDGFNLYPLKALEQGEYHPELSPLGFERLHFLRLGETPYEAGFYFDRGSLHVWGSWPGAVARGDYAYRDVIREKFKEAEITVVCQEHVSNLYESCSAVNSIVATPWEYSSDYESEVRHNVTLEAIKAKNPDTLMNSVFSVHSLSDMKGIPRPYQG